MCGQAARFDRVRRVEVAWRMKMPRIKKRILAAAGAAFFLSSATVAARCENAASEIVIGNVLAPSRDGYMATSLRVARAYLAMVNGAGGIHGRQLRIVSYDAKGDFRRTLDLTRRLVEKDKVTLLYQMESAALGNKPYVVLKRIPQVFDARPNAGSDAGLPARVQGEAIGRAINALMPDATIALLYREDRFSNDALTGLYAGMGDENARLKIKRMEEAADPAKSVAKLIPSKMDLLVVLGDLDMQRKVLRELHHTSWLPITFLTDAAVVLDRKELESLKAVISVDSRMARDGPSSEEQSDWDAFRTKYLAAEDANSNAGLDGYLQVRALVNSLEICGEDAKCLVDHYRRSPSRWIAQTITFEQGAWNAIGPPGGNVSQ
jgi:branched-chain amino acid transport system substrate-binding protein